MTSQLTDSSQYTIAAAASVKHLPLPKDVYCNNKACRKVGEARLPMPKGMAYKD
jgi:hypothetical protein